MAVKINFNEAAAQTHTSLIKNERAMNKSLLRLSTGMRILNAADDSAGLFIADMLSTVAKAYEQGNRNIQTGISALQVAEASTGQIFDKLQEIYTRAQNAANDINDPNARMALQREITNFVDAIQKIGTDTEYNGIRLLDGSFTNKYIHYGPRNDQVVSLSISDVRSTALGAYLTQGTQTSVALSSSGYSTLLSSNTNFQWASTETIKVNGVSFTTGSNIAVDAKYIAEKINNNSDLQNMGISAYVSNKRQATNPFTTINLSDTGQSMTFRFFVGTESTTPSFQFTITGQSGGTSVTLQDLVSLINSNAGGTSLKAEASSDGHLLLSTAGETIGVEVILTRSTTGAPDLTLDLSTILDVASTTVSATGSNTSATGSAIGVGKITIAGTDSFSYDFTGVSSGNEGLGINPPTSSNVNFSNLSSIDVTNNSSAEVAMIIASKAIQKVDTVRAQIGATMNNLQSIFDSQKTAYDNTKEAESVIRNTDYAKEMAEFTTYQIRMQSTIGMLAQANSLPQLVLQLLR